jgi:hypothetical protein
LSNDHYCNILAGPESCSFQVNGIPIYLDISPFQMERTNFHLEFPIIHLERTPLDMEIPLFEMDFSPFEMESRPIQITFPSFQLERTEFETGWASIDLGGGHQFPHLINGMQSLVSERSGPSSEGSHSIAKEPFLLDHLVRTRPLK